MKTPPPKYAGPSAAERQRGYTRRLRREVLALYGGVCEHCGFDDERALQMDHVSENGHRHREAVGGTGVLRAAKVDKYAGGHRFQLLCANCNWIKRHENEEWSGR